jgi:hypothetical protein
MTPQIRVTIIAGSLPDGQNTCKAVNRPSQKYSTLPKFGFVVCSVHPGSSLRGDRTSSRYASRVAVDAAASCARGAGRAGSPCEPEASCGRAALMRTAKPCGPGRRCYGQAFAEVCASPTGRTAPSIRGAREARRKVRLPGEHGISRPTTAQGRPSDWLHLYAAVRSPLRFIRAADRGCQSAPGLPCALVSPKSDRV